MTPRRPLAALRLVWAALCLAAAGCASAQLDFNATDLAESFNSLTRSQIFFNLAQAATDPEFVPSQVTIAIGTAQTVNAVTPSFSVPLWPPVVTTTRYGATAAARTLASQVVTPAPTTGVSAVDGWSQSWTMTPINGAASLRRLRTLYQFATGTLPRRDRTVELTLEQAEKIFLCEYTLQAFSVSPTSGNVSFKLDDCPDNTSRTTRSRIVHADPTFTQGASCVVCIDDLDATQLKPHVNPNLRYKFIATAKSGDMVNIGSHGPIGFWVCESADGNCPRVPGQEPFDGRKAFSDFILFVYEAVTAPSSTGSGRTTAGPFSYSVR